VLGHGSDGRVPSWQAPGPEFKPQYCEREKEKERMDKKNLPQNLTSQLKIYCFGTLVHRTEE
jgi:hypothetical protein